MASRFSLRNLYLYSICLITLLISIFAFVGLVTDFYEVIYPRPEQPHIPENPDYTEQMRYDNILDIVRNTTLLLVAVPTYLYHWKAIQKERSVTPLVNPTDTL